MGVIRLMLDKIEQEQTNKLRSMNDQSKGNRNNIIFPIKMFYEVIKNQSDSLIDQLSFFETKKGKNRREICDG